MTKHKIVEAQLTREVSAGTEVVSNLLIEAVKMIGDLLTEAEAMEVAKNLILILQL